MTVPSTTPAPEGEQVATVKATSASSVVDVSVPFFVSALSERYDQATYYGRFRKMLDVVDPRTLLCSRQDIDDAVGLLKDFETHRRQQRQQESLPDQGDSKSTSSHRFDDAEFDDAELWQAKKIIDAVFHPDTNEMLPKPFRMSGFMPFNVPFCVGALMATSTPSVLFFHWANQTHNALINYHNRNATKPLDNSMVLRGYCGAVGGAIGVAMGLKIAIERSTSLSVVQKLKYQRFSALPAIVTAGALNVLLMRAGELTTGIDIYYEPHKSLPLSAVKPDEASSPVVAGSSQIAAKKALKEMTISRMVFPLPIFLLAPIGMSLIDPILRKNRRFLTLPFQSAFVFLGFGLGLPATIALFPQIGTVEASCLENKFQNLRDSGGNPVTVFRYNKGL